MAFDGQSPVSINKTARCSHLLQGPPPTGGTKVSANFVTESQAKFMMKKVYIAGKINILN
jgi:hypothetical protein